MENIKTYRLRFYDEDGVLAAVCLAIGTPCDVDDEISRYWARFDWDCEIEEVKNASEKELDRFNFEREKGERIIFEYLY